MKILKNLLLTVGIVFCFTLAASAQSQDKDNKPKKDPPVVVVKEKPPKEDKPKNDKGNNVKKPEMFLMLNERFNTGS